MLTKTKLSIRILALVLTLLMTVAVFAGCKDANAQEAADKAQQSADAAQQSADAAQKTANDAQAKANDISGQIEGMKTDIANADKTATDAAAAAAKAQAAADDAKKTAVDYHTGDNKPINEKQYKDATTKIEKDLLPELYKLVAQYQGAQKTWYTADNYNKLTLAIETVNFDYARALTVDGLEKYITDLKATLEAIPNVATEAKKVADLIDAIGNNVTIDGEGKNAAVTAARKGFDAWVADYNSFFVDNNFATYTGALVENGKVVTDGHETAIADFTKEKCNVTLNIGSADTLKGLVGAERRVAVISGNAEDILKGEINLLLTTGYKKYDDKVASDYVGILFGENAAVGSTKTSLADAQKVLTDVLTISEYYDIDIDVIKSNAKNIEDLYTAYRMFYALNGGDTAVLKKFDFTAEKFVKLYVMALYDYEVGAYQEFLVSNLQQLINYFMNTEDTLGLGDEDQLWKNALTGIRTYKLTPDGKEGIVLLKDSDNYFKASRYDITIGTDTVTAETLGGDVILSYNTKKNEIKDLFNAIVTKWDNELTGITYSKDFKGNATLNDAYNAMDQYFNKCFVEMLAAYKTAVLDKVVEGLLEYERAQYMEEYTLQGKANENETYDTEFGFDAFKTTTMNGINAAIDTMIADFKAVKTPTYEELNMYTNKKDYTKNLANKSLFKIDVNAGESYDDVLENVDGEIKLDGGELAVTNTILQAYANCIDQAFTGIFEIDNLIFDAHTLAQYQMQVVREIYDVTFKPRNGFKYDEKGGFKDKITTAQTEQIATATEAYIAWKADEGLADHPQGNLLAKAVLNSKEVPIKLEADSGKAKFKTLTAELKTLGEDLTTIRNRAVKNILAINFADLANAKANYEFEVLGQNVFKKGDKVSYDIVVSRVDAAIAEVNDAFVNEILGDETNLGVLPAYAKVISKPVASSVTNTLKGYNENYSFGNFDAEPKNGVTLKNDIDLVIDYLNAISKFYTPANQKEFADKYGYDLFAIGNYFGFGKNNRKIIICTKAKTYEEFVSYKLNGDKVLQTGDAKTVKFDTTKHYSVKTSVNGDFFDVVDVGTTSRFENNLKAFYTNGAAGTNTAIRYLDIADKDVAKNATSFVAEFIKTGQKDINKFYGFRNVTLVKSFLQAAQELCYLKDDVLNTAKDNIIINGKKYDSINNIYNAYKGVEDVNPATGEKKVYSLFTLSDDALRNEVFQKRLSYVFDNVKSMINDVDILEVVDLVKVEEGDDEGKINTKVKEALAKIEGNIAIILDRAAFTKDQKGVKNALYDNGYTFKTFIDNYKYYDASKVVSTYTAPAKFDTVVTTLEGIEDSHDYGYKYSADKQKFSEDDYSFAVVVGRFLDVYGNYDWQKYYFFTSDDWKTVKSFPNTISWDKFDN